MKPSYENKKNEEGFKVVIGCDEAGRGSLAGPVVAAAVVLPRVKSLKFKDKSWEGIKDSKLLSPSKRELLSSIIKKNSIAWAVGVVSNVIIDRINIHKASLFAMSRAVKKLLGQVPFKEKQFHLAVDGIFIVPDLKISQEAIIDGDNKILSIAAASIIAKVYRDNLMQNLQSKYKVYDFAKHKGYGTFFHRQMISKYGLSSLHRATFCKKITADN